MLSLNYFIIKNKLIFNNISNINNLMLNNIININEYNFIDISKLKGINYLNLCLRKRNYKYHKLKENPKITVIIPVFNCQKSIRLSVASILNQKMEDFEIILVNDNSNDRSLRIIK
jgi:cellulose synthase/poly-beta-1,6-N-acetylglucosamine synthase-like glycosyltransferase